MLAQKTGYKFMFHKFSPVENFDVTREYQLLILKFNSETLKHD